MKKIFLAILLFVSVGCFAQTTQTSYVVPTIAAMKSYYGSANKIYVSSKNQDYAICSPCTTDEVNIYAGAGGRKWMKISDSAKADLSNLAGGATGQALIKNSSTNGDWSWGAVSSGSTINQYDSTITATTAQTVFTYPTFPSTSTYISVFRNGCGIDKSYYTYNSSTQMLTFTGGKVAGDKIRLHIIQ